MYRVKWTRDLAAQHGCRLDGADISPCVVTGECIGTELSNAFIGDWYAVVTAPPSLACAVTLIVISVKSLRARDRA